jgi:hypothetical protein
MLGTVLPAHLTPKEAYEREPSRRAATARKRS